MLVSIEGEWRRAVTLSCAVHLAVLVLLGFVSPGTPKPAVEEVLINLDISEIEKMPDVPAAVLQSAAAVPAKAAAAKTMSTPAAAARRSAPAAAAASENAVAAQPAAGGSDSAAGFAAGGATAEYGEETGGAADGTETSDSGGGSGVDIGAVGNAFAARVDSCKEYPYMAMRRGQTGVVTVFVRLDAGGSLSAVEVTGSSGVASLDESAVKAVRKACPFAHGAGRAVEFVVPIYYELRG